MAPDATSSSGSRLTEEQDEARLHQPIVLRSPVEVIRLPRCGFLACHAQASDSQPSDRRLVCLRPAISQQVRMAASSTRLWLCRSSAGLCLSLLFVLGGTRAILADPEMDAHAREIVTDNLAPVTTAGHPGGVAAAVYVAYSSSISDSLRRPRDGPSRQTRCSMSLRCENCLRLRWSRSACFAAN